MFATKGAWSIHVAKFHLQPQHVQNYVDTGLCWACGMDLHVRPRLLTHLTRRKRKDSFVTSVRQFFSGR